MLSAQTCCRIMTCLWKLERKSRAQKARLFCQLLGKAREAGIDMGIWCS